MPFFQEPDVKIFKEDEKLVVDFVSEIVQKKNVHKCVKRQMHEIFPQL